MADDRVIEEHLVNGTLHICGCETKFDTVAWRSVTIRRCDEHQRIVRIYA